VTAADLSPESALPSWHQDRNHIYTAGSGAAAGHFEFPCQFRCQFPCPLLDRYPEPAEKLTLSAMSRADLRFRPELRENPSGRGAPQRTCRSGGAARISRKIE